MLKPNIADRRFQYFDRAGRLIAADQALDEDGTLRDGCSARTSLMMRDSADLNRPGWRLPLVDTATRDAKQQARDAWIAEQSEAWRHLGTEDARTKKTVKRDPQGREAATEEETEEDDISKDHQPLTLDAARQHHAEVMAEVYRERDEELCNMWRMNK